MTLTLKVGDIVEGKVTGTARFGAFVDLGQGQDGLIHISQISDSYVKDVRDYVKKGDMVKVKVISIDQESGKIGLSLKQVPENKVRQEKDAEKEKSEKSKRDSKKKTSTSDFDKMMNDFLKDSDDRLANLKKKNEGR